MSGSISSTSNTQGSAANTAAARASTGIGADFNTFLTLLTTQLRNQDPTKAMDAQEMTNQLVQFASVEQQLKVNTNLEQLISVQQGSQLVSAAPLMGRVVEVDSDRLSLQNGQAALRLPVAGAAMRAEVAVQDSRGRTVRTAEVTLGANPTTWRWDGRDTSGTQQADGLYRFTVRGLTSDGTTTPVAAGVLGRATAVDRSDGEVRLKLGALSVNFDKLRGLAE